MLDNLERALRGCRASRPRRRRAPEESRSGARGAARLPRAARRAERGRGRGLSTRPARSSTRHVHEALPTLPADGVEAGTVVEVMQKGYRLGRAADPARPRGGERSRRALAERSLQGARRLEEGLRRRDQEGLPQAGAQVPPRPQPRRPKAEEKFKEVQGAYDTLSDPEKRKQYDAGRHVRRLRRRPGGPGGRRAAVAGGFGGVDLGDILSGLFGRGGGGRAQPQQARGRDLETEVSLSFDQAVNGAQISVTVPKAERCPTCHGSGAKPGTAPSPARAAKGAASTPQSQGFFSISQPCPQCGGAGQIIENPCPTCGGSGLTRQTKRYKVNIPAGVKDGTRIRLAGKGEAGPARRPARRPLRDHPGRRLARLQAARRRQPRGDGADHDRRGAARARRSRCRPWTGTQEDQGAGRAPQHGTVQRLRGEGPPKPAARAAATSATGSRSRCPQD